MKTEFADVNETRKTVRVEIPTDVVNAEFDPGDLKTIAFKRASNAINDEAVQMAMQRLRDRGARYEPVEGRGVDHGDTVTVDLERRDAGAAADTHKDVSIEMGAKANPPG